MLKIFVILVVSAASLLATPQLDHKNNVVVVSIRDIVLGLNGKMVHQPNATFVLQNADKFIDRSPWTKPAYTNPLTSTNSVIVPPKTVSTNNVPAVIQKAK